MEVIELEDKLQLLVGKLEEAHVSQKYAIYTQLFECYQLLPKASGRTISLERHRREYAGLFLPSKSFWIAWLNDIIDLSTLSTPSISDATIGASIRRDTFRECIPGAHVSDADYITSVFDMALELCPDLDVLAVYFGYAIESYEDGEMDPQALRNLFERAILVCGGDILSSGELWKLYRAFEVEEYDDLVDTHALANLCQEAKARVIRLFRRQLSLPLIDNETVLRDFDELLSRIAVESDLKLVDPPSLSSKLESSIRQREARLTFEHAFLHDDYTFLAPVYQYMQYWKPYIDLELKAEEMHRAQRLFERALLECSEVLHCWKDYLRLSSRELRNWKLVENICDRAVRIHRDDSQLWTTYLHALEMNQRPLEMLSKTVHFALQNTFPTADAYVVVLCAACDYHRRQLDAARSASKDEVVLGIERLRASFSAAEAFIEMYYPTWLEGFMTVHRYRCRVEDELVADVADSLPEAYRERYKGEADVLWERAVRRHGAHASVWLECIAWARASASLPFCRGLFKKASSVAADRLTLLAHWVQFERETGSLADLLEVESALIAASPVEEEVAAYAMHTEGELPVSAAAEDSPVTSEVVVRPEKRRSDNAMDQSPDPDQSVAKRARLPKPAVAKKPRYSVVVKKLPYDCSEDAISAHFCECGEILHIRLAVSPDGKPKGVATLDFQSVEGRTNALALHGSSLGGRAISVEVVQETVKTAAGASHPTTVFVSKLSKDTVEEHLRSCFEACGTIVAMKLLRDKFTGKSKVSTAFVHMWYCLCVTLIMYRGVLWWSSKTLLEEPKLCDSTNHFCREHIYQFFRQNSELICLGNSMTTMTTSRVVRQLWKSMAKAVELIRRRWGKM